LPRLTTKKHCNNYHLNTMLIIVIIFVASIISWNLFASSFITEIRSSGQALNHLKKEIEELKDLNADSSRLKADWLEIKQEYDQIKYFLPADKELPAVMTDLENLLQPYSNSILSFTAGDIDHGEEFTVLNCRLSASGRPARLQSLLNDLESFIYRPVFNVISWQEADFNETTLNIEFKLLFERNY